MSSRRTRPRLDPWEGRIFLALGRAVYVGPAGDTTPHAHHAIQICVALDAPFRLRGRERGWQEFDAALVPPDVEHQLEGGPGPLLLVYLEPESEDGRDWLPTPSQEIITLDSKTAGALRDCIEGLGSGGNERPDVYEVVPAVLRSAGLRDTPRDATDRRVIDALEILRRSRSRARSLGDLAREVGLSASRFRHIFREQVGMSTQSYVVWLRINDACRALAEGATLTEAALEAGFSDGAHFTRTFRRTFGLAPSQVAGRLELMDPTDVRSSSPVG